MVASTFICIFLDLWWKLWKGRLFDQNNMGKHDGTCSYYTISHTLDKIEMSVYVWCRTKSEKFMKWYCFMQDMHRISLQFVSLFEVCVPSWNLHPFLLFVSLCEVCVPLGGLNPFLWFVSLCMVCVHFSESSTGLWAKAAVAMMPKSMENS